MGFFSRKSKEKKEYSLLQSLCLGMVGDIGQLLDEKGFKKPVRTLEVIMFSMFILTETYTLANKKCKESTSSKLFIFCGEMFRYFADEHLKKNMTIDENNVVKLFDEFNNIVDKRNAEYQQHFKEDLNNPATIYRKTISAFLEHLFVEPISENDKQAILIPLALKFTEFYTISLKSFR